MKQKNGEVKEITLEDIVEKTFYETREQRLKRMQEKYTLNEKEDIESLLSSNLTYREKLEILGREKDRVKSLSSEIEEAEYNFKNTRIFIGHMRRACAKIKNQMKFDVPLTIGGICISSATFYQLSKFLDNHKFTSLPLDQFLAFLLGGVFAPIVSLIYTYYVVNDFADYREYQKQIKSYERRLKKRQ